MRGSSATRRSSSPAAVRVMRGRHARATGQWCQRWLIRSTVSGGASGASCASTIREPDQSIVWTRMMLRFARFIPDPPCHASSALTLSGFKAVSDGAGFDLWPNTTTPVYPHLRGHVGPDDGAAATVVGA